MNFRKTFVKLIDKCLLVIEKEYKDIIIILSISLLFFIGILSSFKSIELLEVILFIIFLIIIYIIYSIRSNNTNLKTIELMVGPSGSGKSIYSKMLVDRDNNKVIINRDKLREMLFGYTEMTITDYYKNSEFKRREKIVTEIQYLLIEHFCESGKIPIVDDTNINLRFLDDLLDRFQGYKFNYEAFNLSLDDLISNDKRRQRQVGQEVIKRQYDLYQINYSKILTKLNLHN